MRSPADRRDQVRFEVFGPFWGAFDVNEPVRVLDLSPNSALIEAQQPLAVESVQSVRLTIDGQPTVTEAKVNALPLAVRLLDISLSGVRLESAHPVELGTRGTLRFNFGGVPFSADVKVERLSSAPMPSGSDSYSIGATFVVLSRQDQRVIERFADQ